MLAIPQCSITQPRAVSVLSRFSCVRLFVTLWICCLLGSSVYGVLQATTLEWVAISLSRGSSRPRDGTRVFVQILYCLSHHNKGPNTDTCIPWRNLGDLTAGWKKPDSRWQILCVPFMWNAEKRQIHRDRKQTSNGWGLRDLGGNEEWPLKGDCVSLGVMMAFCN